MHCGARPSTTGCRLGGCFYVRRRSADGSRRRAIPRVHDIDVGSAASSGRTERKTDATEEPRDVRPHERIRPASHASGPVLPTAIVYRSYVLITSSMACSASSHAV